VQVFDEDRARLGEALLAKFVVASGEKNFMRMVDGHCAALNVAGGEFHCGIYEERPVLCRAYELYGPQSKCPPRPEGLAPAAPRTQDSFS